MKTLTGNQVIDNNLMAFNVWGYIGENLVDLHVCSDDARKVIKKYKKHEFVYVSVAIINLKTNYIVID